MAKRKATNTKENIALQKTKKIGSQRARLATKRKR